MSWWEHVPSALPSRTCPVRTMHDPAALESILSSQGGTTIPCPSTGGCVAVGSYLAGVSAPSCDQSTNKCSVIVLRHITCHSAPNVSTRVHTVYYGTDYEHTFCIYLPKTFFRWRYTHDAKQLKNNVRTQSVKWWTYRQNHRDQRRLEVI